MSNNRSRREFCATAIATIFASATSVKAAEKKYDPGASDTEIKIGQTVPHSGPGSLYGVIGRVGEAYFQMLNDKGGINGRKVKFFTMDDAYSAPKCVEATRRLVEQEEVLALFGSLGTAPQTAVHKYLNSKGVPQLLLNTGASKWNDPKNFKWTMAGLPLYPTEARILARHVVAVKPNAKVAILYAKEVGVPRWEKDPDVMAFEELRKKYLPTVDPDNTIAFAGYGQVATMAEILRRCGDDLTRVNVLKQATTLSGFHSPYFLDGINFSYTPDDYTPMKTLYISEFNGKDWDISDKPVTE